MRRLLAEVRRDVPGSTVSYQSPVYRDATPEEVIAAFLADAEASGAGESIRSRIGHLHGYGGRVYEIAEESAIETLDALGLSALLAEPKPKEGGAQ